MRPGEAAADVAAVACLSEPTRRHIYDHVRAQAVPVSRDEVAKALGVPRRTVAFHLDRLAEQHLVVVSFARRSGRSGPGAGRPAKLYRRSAREVSISLPPRHYDLVGSLLAGAFVEAQDSGESPRDVLARRARELGRALVSERSGDGDTPDEAGPAQLQAAPDEAAPAEHSALMDVLSDHGYEPAVDGRDIVLLNCPFHAMAQEHTELVCGMNLNLLEGVLTGLGSTGLRAFLDPSPSRCCVRLVQ